MFKIYYKIMWMFIMWLGLRWVLEILNGVMNWLIMFNSMLIKGLEIVIYNILMDYMVRILLRVVGIL